MLYAARNKNMGFVRANNLLYFEGWWAFKGIIDLV